ncbi:hypothetical protein CY0110_17772 [Crocosphaera chwakensis CCY0110]|uniref:Uncharacterized protein n=1 Tax=Crocosphaera chwakensis CCY0110 TaxID=391612 RepID=A3IIN6_9CHRO|nr:hypothetical protein CY0110_17772 [Crocosphaera chwakensis CCY0110]
MKIKRIFLSDIIEASEKIVIFQEVV